jgi:single-stranded-DNA-specific exonuclease
MRQRRIWQVKKSEESTVAFLADALGISRVSATVLVNRGITTPAAAMRFFHGALADLSNPLELPDMERGAARICRALQSGEKILVYGDYDVDGITGTALLTDVLRSLGGQVEYYIPDRLEEGYGLNIQALTRAMEAGNTLIISVDCGISSVDEAAFAAQNGLDLVITDHHQPPAVLPDAAFALINPKLADDEQLPWYNLAGVGVAFKVAQAVAAMLSHGNLCDGYLDLVALGTIADIVPLLEENRILVKEGLQRLNQGQCRPGLQALLKSAGLKYGAITAGEIGFILAPRLNACGRLAKADIAVELLLGQDLKRNEEICGLLEEENRHRQEMGEEIFREAVAMLEKEEQEQKVIVLASNRWHPGVIGIVASRLAEKYYRPTFLLNIEEGIAKGSARSIPGFNLYQALDNVRNCLLRFGGHEMAAGLALEENDLPLLQAELQQYAESVLEEKSYCPVLKLDTEVTFTDVHEKLIEELTLLEPFGAGNPNPVFVLRNSSLTDVKAVGQNGKHLKLAILDPEQARRIDGIGFQLGELQEEAACWARCDLAFIPELNTFQGVTRLQLKIRDLKDTIEPDDIFTPLSFLEQLYLDGEIWLEDDYFRDILDKEEFFTKVAGVTFTDRQKIIRGIQAGDAVYLQRELDNPFDSNAIAVYYQDSSIGYLQKRLAKYLATAMDHGTKYEAYVTQVTGGEKEKDILGVNLCIRKMNAAKGEENLAVVKEELLKYSSAELGEKIRRAILGDAEYHEKQKEAIRSLKSGQNTLIVFGTGRGKSAVFQAMAVYQALAEHKITFLLYPLRSLVNDQYHRLQRIMTPLGIKVAAINGSVGIHEKKEFFKDYLLGKVDVVLTTPEFLAFHLEKFGSMAERIGFFVVDEAHHLAEGKRRGYRLLSRCWRQLGQPLALAATATAEDETVRVIGDTLNITRMVLEKHVRENLQLVDKRREKDKLPYLLKLVDTKERIVIYVNSRKQAYQLASDLRYYYPAAKDEIGFYHGGLYSAQRNQLEKMFRDGQLRVMVTTSAFGEGIDIPDIQNVVLYHLCFSLTEFNQLAGRAGRNGKSARIHLLFNEEDKKLNELLLEAAAPTRKVLAKFYTYLREQGKKGEPLQFTNRQLQEAMQRLGEKNFREQTASICLGILEDLGLLLREVEGKTRYLHLVPPPPGKLDLADSIRFVEGQDEWEDFQSFAEFALHASAEHILAAVNQPICPAQTA